MIVVTYRNRAITSLFQKEDRSGHIYFFLFVKFPIVPKGSFHTPSSAVPTANIKIQISVLYTYIHLVMHQQYRMIAL